MIFRSYFLGTLHINRPCVLNCTALALLYFHFVSLSHLSLDSLPLSLGWYTPGVLCVLYYTPQVTGLCIVSSSELSLYIKYPKIFSHKQFFCIGLFHLLFLGCLTMNNSLFISTCTAWHQSATVQKILENGQETFDCRMLDRS